MSPLSPIDAAKSCIIAYGKKNWDELRASLVPGVLYNEVATHRKTKGIEDILAIFQGWAAAFPDSKAKFHAVLSSGNTVVMEITWGGTHSGPLQLPGGPVKATGRTFEVPACVIVEVEGDKAKSIRQYFDMATLLHQLGVALAA